jgi:hypothetical protein
MKDQDNNSYGDLLAGFLERFLEKHNLQKHKYLLISLSVHFFVIGTFILMPSYLHKNKGVDVADEVSVPAPEQAEQQKQEKPGEQAEKAASLSEAKPPQKDSALTDAPAEKPAAVEEVKKKAKTKAEAKTKPEAKKEAIPAQKTVSPPAETQPAETFSSGDLKKRLEEKLKGAGEKPEDKPQENIPEILPEKAPEKTPEKPADAPIAP